MTIRESFMASAVNENYPPGAANDPRAPYNQSSPESETKKIDGTLYDKEGDEQFPIKIEYTFYEDEDGRKYITDWSHTFVNPDDEAKVEAKYIEEDVKNQIGEDAGEHEFR